MYEDYEGQLKNQIRLFMLRCEAALLTSRNTDPHSAFTETRTKKQILQEIKDYNKIIQDLQKEKVTTNPRALLNYMYNY